MQRSLLKSIIFFLCLMATHPASTQDVDVYWSPEFEEEKGESLGQVLHDDGEHIYVFVKKVLKRGKDGMIPGILKLDRNMKPVQREDYTVAQEDISFRGMFYMGNQFMMVTLHYDKKSNTAEVFGVSIDQKTLKPGMPQSLYKISAPPKIDIYFEYDVSIDSSMLFLKAGFEQKDDEQRKFAYKIVDRNLKTIQEKTVVLDYTVDDSRILDFEVSKDGDLYMVGKAYMAGAKKETTRGSKTERTASYDIMLKKFSRDNTEKDFKIPMGKNLLDSYVMRTDPVSDDLYLLGTFQNVEYNGLNGYFFMRVDSKTGTVMATKENKFTLPMITRVNEMSNTKTKGANPGISTTFNFKHFIMNPDGSIYGILERNYSITTTTKYGSYTTFFSEGIIAFQLDKDGNQRWINFIPKRQFYNSLTDYLSNSVMVTDDELIIFYNDNNKNLAYDLNSNEEPKRFNELKEMNFMKVSIDHNGKMTRKEFANSEQMGTVVYINGTKQVRDNHFIIYGFKYKQKINKLGLAVFK